MKHFVPIHVHSEGARSEKKSSTAYYFTSEISTNVLIKSSLNDKDILFFQKNLPTVIKQKVRWQYTIFVLSSNFLLENGHGGICKNNVFVILHVYSGANVSYLASDHLCIRASYSSKSCIWCKCNVFLSRYKKKTWIANKCNCAWTNR